MRDGCQRRPVAREGNEEDLAPRASVVTSEQVSDSGGPHEPAGSNLTSLNSLEPMIFRCPAHGTGSVRSRGGGQKECTKGERELILEGGAAINAVIDASPTIALASARDSCDVSAETTDVVESELSDSAQDSEDALEAPERESLKKTPRTAGLSPLYGHLLSEVLALVGDEPWEKARLGLVCSDWKDALDVHTA